MNLTALPGTLVDGKYRIEKLLGQGGMGAVFVATHLGTTRTVAVKVIVPQLAAQDEFLLRFEREAEAAGRLRHPNVVNVTDFGFTSLGDGGGQLAYLVMEFLDGQTLATFIKSNPNPPLDLILDIVDQVALGLDAAHEAGIVHRDLKPDNVWLESNRRGGYYIKVLDFGIAKINNPTGTPQARPQAPALPAIVESNSAEPETLVIPASPIDKTEAVTIATSSQHSQGGSVRFNAATLQTTVGSILGTPSFMAPEQCQGAMVDHRADIYSLATIAYQLFCGRLPFDAKNLRELLDQQINATPPEPHQVDKSIPLGVSQTISRGLSKDPSNRQVTASTFAAQLRSGGEGETSFLASGKFYANNYLTCFLPLLFVCFFPHLPIATLLVFTASVIAGTKTVPIIVLLTAMHVISFAVLLFLSQAYKAAMSMVFKDACAMGYFRPQIGSIVTRLIRGLGPMLRLYLSTLPRLSWISFREAALWPVVWAAEGLTGKAALERAAALTATQPASTGALIARQYGVILGASLASPALFVGLTGSYSEYGTLLFSGKQFWWFAILYPLFFCPVFLGFGPAFEFMYRSARRCLGEQFEWALPSGSRQKRNSRTRSVRPGTLMWLAPATLMLGTLVFQAFPHGLSTVNLVDAMFDGRRKAGLQALDSGISVESKDTRGRTPLMIAAMTGNLLVTGQMLDRGAKINARSNTGSTALMFAVTYGHPQIAALLLEKGADPNVSQDDKQTPLMHVAMRGDAQACSLLLKHGAKPELRDDHGKSAADFAKEEGYTELLPLLR